MDSSNESFDESPLPDLNPGTDTTSSDLPFWLSEEWTGVGSQQPTVLPDTPQAELPTLAPVTASWESTPAGRRWAVIMHRFYITCLRAEQVRNTAFDLEVGTVRLPGGNGFEIRSPSPLSPYFRNVCNGVPPPRRFKTWEQYWEFCARIQEVREVSRLLGLAPGHVESQTTGGRPPTRTYSAPSRVTVSGPSRIPGGQAAALPTLQGDDIELSESFDAFSTPRYSRPAQRSGVRRDLQIAEDNDVGPLSQLRCPSSSLPAMHIFQPRPPSAGDSRQPTGFGQPPAGQSSSIAMVGPHPASSNTTAYTPSPGDAYPPRSRGVAQPLGQPLQHMIPNAPPPPLSMPYDANEELLHPMLPRNDVAKLSGPSEGEIDSDTFDLHHPPSAFGPIYSNQSRPTPSAVNPLIFEDMRGTGDSYSPVPSKDPDWSLLGDGDNDMPIIPSSLFPAQVQGNRNGTFRPHHPRQSRGLKRETPSASVSVSASAHRTSSLLTQRENDAAVAAADQEENAEQENAEQHYAEPSRKPTTWIKNGRNAPAPACQKETRQGRRSDLRKP